MTFRLVGAGRQVCRFCKSEIAFTRGVRTRRSSFDEELTEMHCKLACVSPVRNNGMETPENGGGGVVSSLDPFEGR